MGNTNSIPDSQAGQPLDIKKLFTNAQLSDNVENMFKSSLTSRNMSNTHISQSYHPVSTSSVDVDTIINMSGGGSRVSVLPRRRRYQQTQSDYDNDSMFGGDNTMDMSINTDDINYVKDLIYPQNSESQVNTEDVGNNLLNIAAEMPNNDSEMTRLNSASVDYAISTESVGGFSATSHMNQADAASLAHSATSAGMPYDSVSIGDFSATSPDMPMDTVNEFSATSPDMPVDTVNQFSATSPGMPSESLSINNFSATSPDVNMDGGFSAPNNFNTIDAEINAIRQHLNATIHKQNGGSGVANDNSLPQPQPQSQVNEDILSEDGLSTIRASLAKQGVVNMQEGGNIEGNIDADLQAYREKLLQNNNNFSATSPDPSNILNNMVGGNQSDSDEDDEDIDEDADEDVDDSDSDSEDDEDEMKGGVTRKSKSSSSSSDDSESDSDTDSSSSLSSSSYENGRLLVENDLSEVQRSINRTMNRRNTNSKYLRNNEYKVTSNSDRDYKITNRMVYSSQSSDVHASVGGSEYLNSLRNRDRMM